MNFKRFRDLEINFDPQRNILVGDNEAGKSTILTAIELVLGGSRSSIEALGVEVLLNAEVVTEFLAGNKSVKDLPTLLVELYLGDVDNEDLDGRNNTEGKDFNGLQLSIEPNEDLTKEISSVLAAPGENFPFEFYVAKFTTFSGDAYSGYRKFVRYIALDSTQINSEYATNQYVKAMYEATAEQPERYRLKNEYRKQKNDFRDVALKVVNDQVSDYDFSIKSGSKFNLETDLTLTEEGIPIEQRGKGKQCFIKTAFALRERHEDKKIDVLLLEEPENHLSHTSMYKLISQVENAHRNQVIIATHSSLICSRLDLRKSILLNSNANVPAMLKDLTSETAKFFEKAPDHNILELVLSDKVILVEGDAEYILMERLYQNVTGRLPTDDGAHIVSIGGTSFKRYMEVSKILNIRTAVIRDNDGDYTKNCLDNYTDYVSDNVKVYADSDIDRYTFEVCMYRDNKDLCDDVFSRGRIQLQPQDYMLNNKTESALKLLLEDDATLVVPAYIQEAIEWLNE